jgi:ABC-2 type transport system permease protein
MRAMILKELLELRRDRRSMALLVVLPLLLLVVFGYAANFNVTSVPTHVVGPRAEQTATHLPAAFRVTSVRPDEGTSDAVSQLRNSRARVVIVTSASGPSKALIDGSDLFGAKAATAAVTRSGVPLVPRVEFNPGLKTSWVMVPSLVGLILTFIGTIITSIGLVRERQSGTLEQLAVMPFRPVDVIVGKVTPYFLVAAFDMVLVTVLGCLLFGVPFAGNVAYFALGAAVFLFAVLGGGVLISTLSQNQGQAVQMALLVMLPQILLSGMIFPLASMGSGVRWISYALPLTYFNKISQGVMLRDASFSCLWQPLTVLAGIAAVVFGAAVLRFRRDLAPRIPAAAPATGSATAAVGGAW